MLAQESCIDRQLRSLPTVMQCHGLYTSALVEWTLLNIALLRASHTARCDGIPMAKPEFLLEITPKHRLSRIHWVAVVWDALWSQCLPNHFCSVVTIWFSSFKHFKSSSIWLAMWTGCSCPKCPKETHKNVLWFSDGLTMAVAVSFLMLWILDDLFTSVARDLGESTIFASWDFVLCVTTCFPPMKKHSDI